MKKINPIEIFSNSFLAAKFWFTAFLLVTVALVASPYLTIKAMKEQDKVVIMDRAGVIHRAPLLKRFEATEIFEELGERALDALFMKNPDGYDREKLLHQLFLPSAMKDINKITLAEQKIFKEFQIHQKWELDGMVIKFPTRHTITVLASGQLIRNGNVNKSEYWNKAYDFKVLLTFTPSPNMSNNDRMPYSVRSLKYKVTKQKDEK